MRAALAILAALFAPAGAFACSFVIEPHVLDPHEQKVDSLAPEGAGGVFQRITRGRGAVASGDGTISVTSCDDIGTLALKLNGNPRDDRTPPEKLGYAIVHVAGALPENFEIPVEAMRSSDEGELAMYWSDGATEEQEPIDFTVSIITIDLAGNRSEPSEPIRIQHPGK